MRTTLLGVFAAFAIGCGGPAIGTGSSALKEAPQPPTPTPPWCANCPTRAQPSWQRPVIDPERLAVEYGRPELAPEIARRAALLDSQLDQARSAAEADALVAAFGAELDRLADAD